MDPTFSRVLLFRHLAICASALMAYALRSELPVGYAVLAIVGGSAVLNFILYLLQTRSVVQRWALVASPVIGVGSWAFLIAVTKGVGSPFIAGLWLEVILSSMVFTHVGVFAVTAAAVASLIAQQAWLGLEGNWLALVLYASFIVAMGWINGALSLREQRKAEVMEREQVALGSRVDALVEEVEDERELGRMGANVGRLAHRLKNTVHSMRGFVSLIEPNTDKRSQAALQGLRTAIDDLEALAMTTLGDAPSPQESTPRSERAKLALVATVVDETLAASPGVDWQLELSEPDAELPLSPSELHEVVQILLRNAVEAMGGSGKGRVEVGTDSGACRIEVRDEGPGFAPGDVDALFKPGYTTKPEGSGYGLFLARRVLKQHGGELRAEVNEGGGACFIAEIPLSSATSH